MVVHTLTIRVEHLATGGEEICIHIAVHAKKANGKHCHNMIHASCYNVCSLSMALYP